MSRRMHKILNCVLSTRSTGDPCKRLSTNFASLILEDAPRFPECRTFAAAPLRRHRIGSHKPHLAQDTSGNLLLPAETRIPLPGFRCGKRKLPIRIEGWPPGGLSEPPQTRSKKVPTTNLVRVSQRRVAHPRPRVPSLPPSPPPPSFFLPGGR